ncbi:mitochondrial 54S ribosomal protein mL49 [Lachancea thermotolerans CBS 6340]|uniref:Large ribosomal subunit protein mL49 n=1 Tax=Lachancea thermotolerans (strain ATCC 56472 / CBS 6340 / NRRL Y-8284) TaxID=559295 RepID=C5DC01_LACTC|nr:mitochondrial 54S ribosomal protein IMG2 [Lachancea thermotolerans CBS 6340]CAR21308.1 KLTH0A06732p [Lachancea thermotolerans CBS 6340]
MLVRFGLRTARHQGGLVCSGLQTIRPAMRLASSSLDINSGKLDDGRELSALTEQEINDLSTAFEEQTFSVFPRLQDVKPEELVGFAKFGVQSYFIERSATGNLPVYTDFKRGGKVVTEIRKIHGDPVQLRNDLQARLSHLPKDSFKVMMQAKKIIIEGDVVRQVKEALSSKF